MDEFFPIDKIAEALQRQGYGIEIDEDSRGNRYMDVFAGVHLIAVFSLNPRDYRARQIALSACRRNGFHWPD